MLDGVGHGDFGNLDSPAWVTARPIIVDHVHADGHTP